MAAPEEQKLPDDLISDPASLSFAGGLFVFLVGIVVLVGWQFDIAYIKSVIPDTVSMKANTALCFALLGAAIMASRSALSSRPARWLAVAASSAVAVIGGLSLLEYALGVDFGIDQLLYVDAKGLIGTSNPGRMADAAAVTFIIQGAYVAWLWLRRDGPMHKMLPTIGLLLGLFLSYLTLGAYALGTGMSVGIAAHTREAFHTALTLMISAMSIALLPRAQQPASRLLKRTEASRLLRVVMPSVIIAPLLIAWVLRRFVTGAGLEATTANALGVTITSVALAALFWHFAEVRERADEAARRVAELKDQFLFLAAHELRAPVTGIKWGIELARSELDEGGKIATANAALDEAHRNAANLASLVNDLLDTSRLDYGTFKVSPARTDITACVGQAIESLRDAAQSAGIEIRWSPVNAEVSCVTDAGRLKEILINLLSNAIKYNRRGGWVAVSVHEADGRVIIDVRDSGIGLSKQDIPKLFQRFSRIESGDTKDVAGTGLGLFIVAKIAALLGGTVVAESPGRGQGSTFTISLPKGG
ncbi:MAG: hypothetical protein RL272_1047 [Candidatus Parcubacteria bacterium]